MLCLPFLSVALYKLRLDNSLPSYGCQQAGQKFSEVLFFVCFFFLFVSFSHAVIKLGHCNRISNKLIATFRTNLVKK